MEFTGVLKNQQVEFPEVNEKQHIISSGDREKTMWNFQESWFQALKFPRGVKQFCGVSRGKALFCLEF